MQEGSDYSRLDEIKRLYEDLISEDQGLFVPEEVEEVNDALCEEERIGSMEPQSFGTGRQVIVLCDEDIIDQESIDEERVNDKSVDDDEKQEDADRHSEFDTEMQAADDSGIALADEAAGNAGNEQRRTAFTATVPRNHRRCSTSKDV